MSVPAFISMIGDAYLSAPDKLRIMQVNVGRLCNLSCRHCHMEAGPTRTEIMDRPVMEACLLVLRQNSFATLDITGGAPEMNPHFRWFIREAARNVGQIIVRTNLVILLEPGYEDLPALYRELGIELACSLPCYTSANTDEMRGNSVFDRSIEALRCLNALGYGIDSQLPLNLVYNPGGAYLPPQQQALEYDYRQRLRNGYGVEFTNLLAITNNPVGRFGVSLLCDGDMQAYLEELYSAFNADTLAGIMCREQVSVAYDGSLYDCDFNQAAGLPLESGETIFDWQNKPVQARHIRFGQHCYACTAGQGSSCGGATGAGA